MSRAKSISLLAMPPVFIRPPARMKKGMASRAKESLPAMTFWAAVNADPLKSPSKTRMASMEGRPIETATGTPMAMPNTMPPMRTRLARAMGSI